ncbi:hypothetical protein [Chitinophaga sp. YIM B06452]|uniref:hypothetical protein n=1 Tax=Chitinophaga sp. YIM B06452 TaxID=3082158 RepID=UPI0031FE9FBA
MNTQENIDVVYAQLLEIGLPDRPNNKNWITQKILEGVQAFDILVFLDQDGQGTREIFGCKITCKCEGGIYHVPGMQARSFPISVIEHMEYKGINTFELQQRMATVFWNDQDTTSFFHLQKSAERPLNEEERFVQQIYLDVITLMQSGNTQAVGISLQLQQNFWFGQHFGQHVGLNRDSLTLSPGITYDFDFSVQQFTIQEAKELLQFRPVRKSVYTVPQGVAYQWYQLSQKERNNDQCHLKAYPDFDLPVLLEPLTFYLGPGLQIALDRLHAGKPLFAYVNDKLFTMSIDAANISLRIEDDHHNTYSPDIFADSGAPIQKTNRPVTVKNVNKGKNRAMNKHPPKRGSPDH